jgi:ascorbate-specific PTS system EIIC-type component UlaA
VLFRSYAVVGGLLTLLVTVLFVAAVVGVIAATTGGRGGSLTLSRSFIALVGLLVVAPLLAPVLLVARRHRRGESDGPAYDAALGIAGYLFVLALYVGLVISVPPAQQSIPTGPLAPVVAALYALPQLAGLGPPVGAALAIPVVHRLAT